MSFIGNKHVVLDPRLVDNPPSSWTEKTTEGTKSWMRYNQHLDSKEVKLTIIDQVWRSIEHQHIENGITRFFYINDNYPKECYVYDTKMQYCVFCKV